MSMIVKRPGLLSSFQDSGRWGYQHLGVSVTGAMDIQSHQMANLIAGNTDDCATLEITLLGPTLVFTEACCICLAGAQMNARMNGRPVPRYRPLIVRPTDTLTFETASEGTRAYLAVHGGFDLAPVMGSQSTYLRAGFGGWQGRALKKDDEIPFRAPLLDSKETLTALIERIWDQVLYLPSMLGQHTGRKSLVRLIRSDQWPEFTAASRAAMVSGTWRISTDSERMGYRLQGPEITLEKPREMISEATSFGSIQVPRGGQPIVLMADRQTSGGYPKIATVASVDLPILAQKKPGDEVRFTLVDVEHAQQLDRAKAAALDELSVSLASIRQWLCDARATVN
jgi:antagonist of KipI